MSKPQTGLAQGLSEEATAALWALGSPLRAPAGTLLFGMGDQADRVYQVITGRVNLTLPMQVRGIQQDVMVEERMAGETLGWSGLIPPHHYTLKASTPIDSELIVFPREALLGYFADHPEIAAAVTRNVAIVIGHRLQVFQAMWLREMQRMVDLRYS